jgi:hypothetical protein
VNAVDLSEERREEKLEYRKEVGMVGCVEMWSLTIQASNFKHRLLPQVDTSK